MAIPTFEDEFKRIVYVKPSLTRPEFEKFRNLKTYGDPVNFITEKTQNNPSITMCLDETDSTMVVATITGSVRIPLKKLEMLWALNVAFHSLEQR